MRAGIDKISVHTSDYQIDNLYNTGLFQDRGKIDLSTGESGQDVTLFDRAGNELTGAKFFANHEDGVYSININSRGVQVLYNPSKFHHQYNLTSDPEQLLEAWQFIEADLNERGIKSNWHTANVTRLDLAKNTTLNNPCMWYDPLWKLLEVKRTKNPKQYPDGYASHNNSSGVNFYNKGREANAPELGDNTLRGEYQFKKRNSVRTGTGLIIHDHVIRAGEGYINDVFKNTIQDRVFRLKQADNQLLIPFTDTEALFHQYVQTSKRTAVKKLVGVLGTTALLDQIGGVKGFRLMLQRAGYSRQAINDNVNDLMKLEHDYSRLMSKTDNVSSMYREVLTKLVA